MNKIVLTGATGFVGKNLKSYLENSIFSIYSLGREDLVSAINFKNENAIIHLAGKAHDLKKASNPNEYYEVNYELTKRLYDAFLLSNAKIFIFISSVKAVADVVEGVVKEDIIPNPQTPYGKSKLMAEEYIQSQPLPQDKFYYILRPCMIHGPGNKGNLNLLYKFVQKGIPYPLATFENRRSFLSVNNLCFIIEKLLSSEGIPSGVYNVADDDAISTNELISIIAGVLGFKPLFLRLNSKLVKSIATLGDWLRLPFNTERLNKLTENYVVSNEKIKRTLNINRFPTSSQDGLTETISFFSSK